MDPLVSQTQADQRDVLIKHADEQIANTREQITKADEQIARVHEELSRLESIARRHPPETRTPTTAPRPVKPTRHRPVIRGLVSLLLAAFICLAAIAWRSPVGDAARSVLGRSVPQFAQASLPSPKEPTLSVQPASSGVQAAAGEPSQQMPSAQRVLPNGAMSAESSPELAETLQTVVSNLANLAQAVEQLRASQEQMAGDFAKAVDQLKNNQEQMTRVLEKLSEQNLQAATLAAPPRSIPPATRKPVATSALSPATRQETPAQRRADDPRTASTARPPVQPR
jgi:hypothetical protein